MQSTSSEMGKSKSVFSQVSAKGQANCDGDPKFHRGGPSHVIQNCTDHHSWAQSRYPIHMVRQGSSVRLFQERQERVWRHSCRRYGPRDHCRAGPARHSRLGSAPVSVPEGAQGRYCRANPAFGVVCHPAWSMMSTPWAPGAMALLISARCRPIASVLQPGRTGPAPVPFAGRCLGVAVARRTALAGLRH